MQIKVPKTIQVGGHVYSVRFNHYGVKDDGDYATVNHRTQLIELDPECPESQKRGALIHEILHIIDCVYLARTLQEKDIEAIAEGLNQVFPQLGIELDWSEIEKV